MLLMVSQRLNIKKVHICLNLSLSRFLIVAGFKAETIALKGPFRNSSSIVSHHYFRLQQPPPATDLLKPLWILKCKFFKVQYAFLHKITLQTKHCKIYASIALTQTALLHDFIPLSYLYLFPREHLILDANLYSSNNL